LADGSDRHSQKQQIRKLYRGKIVNTIIRPLRESDRDNWQELFTAYQKFYRASIPAIIVDHTWRRLFDAAATVNALCAEIDGTLAGFTHFLFHESTWSDRPNCYLEDLYVDPVARGTDTAKNLILGVEEAAREKNAFRLYWHTQQYNGKARSLYDSITPPSSFIVYRKGL
jgi:GNAT superfamily N-acetyltransferase